MDYFMVVDVESIGLHGPAFAVGYVVIDLSGHEIESRLYWCESAELPEGVRGDGAWVAEHVMSAIAGPPTHMTTMEVQEAFWEDWLRWREKGARMVADCPWPVESRFLNSCVDRDREARQGLAPYPLFDAATMIYAAGLNPLENFERLPDELPRHNPRNDARQSARIWISALRQLR